MNMKSEMACATLSDKELAELLADIKGGEEELIDTEAELEQKIKAQEEDDELAGADYSSVSWRALPWESVHGSDYLAKHGEEARKKLLESSQRAKVEKRRSIKERRLGAQREAFSQSLLPLSAPMPEEHAKLLLSTLTSGYTQIVEAQAHFINSRLATMLLAAMPKQIKNCWRRYPDSIRMSPGFLYTASKEYGSGMPFWATPRIPYYFEQGEEQEVLEARVPRLLYSIDKAVQKYSMNYAERQKKEVLYASRLVSRKVNTYFDLLKLEPLWFEALYKAIKAERHEYRLQP